MSKSVIPGRPAPALRVETLDGAPFDVSDISAPFLQLVEIYRGRHCPRCHRHLLALEGVLPRLADRGVEAIAISTDPEDRARSAKEDWGLKNLRVGYGLTPDTARAWGLYLSDPITENEPQPFSEPGTFWVRPDGTLYAAMVGTTPFSRPHWADWLEALDAIRARDYPPRGDLG